MNRFAKVLILSACVIALGGACGSDEDEGGASGTTAGTGTGGSSGEAGESGTTGGSSNTGGTGGSGGSGGSSGSGGSGGTGGSAAQPVVCGGETCEAPASSRLTACCIEDSDVCGQKLRGGFVMSVCSKPAEPHPECESIMAAMGFTLPSCCTPEGRCGIHQPLFSFPCTSYEELAAIAADAGVGADGGTGDGGTSNPFAVTPPEPKACTPQ